MNLKYLLILGVTPFLMAKTPPKAKRLAPLKIEGKLKKPELTLESPEKIEGDGHFIDPYDHWELREPAETSL